MDRKKAENVKRSDNEEVNTILHKIFDEKMLPKDAMGLSSEIVEGMYGQAYVLYNSGRYKEASQVFRLLITLDPTAIKYTLGLAASQHMMKDYANAVVTYQMCALMDPENPLPQYHASDCFLKMNDKESAIAALTMAVANAGNTPEYQTIADRCTMMIQSLKE